MGLTLQDQPDIDRGTSRTRPREAGLDLLRLVAVLLVLGRHMWEPPSWLPAGWQLFLSTWYRGGWVGVDLFFVLSGFLVSGLLFAEYKARGQVSFGRFVIRRAFKIYPPLWVLIAFTVADNLARGIPTRWSGLTSELLFLQSYINGLWGHTWSLAVEEHFYLVLPLAMMLLLRFNRKSATRLRPILLLIGSFAVIALVARLLTFYYRVPYSHMTHLFASHLRLDSLFFGVAISYAYHFHASRFVAMLTPWRLPLIVSGMALLTPAFLFTLNTTPFVFTVGLTLFYLGSGLLLIGTLLSNIRRAGLFGFLATIGAHSYSIYLWHLPMKKLGVPLIEQMCRTSFPYGIKVSVYMVGSIVAGMLMARIVEIPALALRDRWFPSRGVGPIEGRPGPVTRAA